MSGAAKRPTGAWGWMIAFMKKHGFPPSTSLCSVTATLTHFFATALNLPLTGLVWFALIEEEMR